MVPDSFNNYRPLVSIMERLISIVPNSFNNYYPLAAVGLIRPGQFYSSCFNTLRFLLQLCFHFAKPYAVPEWRILVV